MIDDGTSSRQPPKGHFRQMALNTVEGRILLTGIMMTAVYFSSVVIVGFWSGPVSYHLTFMAGTHFLFGRAAGLSYGYSLDYNHWVVIPLCMWLETVMVLILYPLCVLSLNKVVVFKALQEQLAQPLKTAKRHRKWIRRFGMAGLFVFVWLPIWMTGPVVGCLIGYLMGMTPLRNLTVVLLATYIAILSWAFLLRELQDALADYGSYAPLGIIVAVICITIAGYLWQHYHGSSSKM